MPFASEFPLDDKCDPKFVREIGQENEEFRRMQTVFSECVFDFMTRIPDFEIFFMYFLNVFCHSSMTAKCSLMKSCFRKFLTTNSSEILQYFVEHFDSVSNILVHCSGP